MDPISVAGVVCGMSKVLYEVSAKLHQLISDSHHIDHAVALLCAEVNGLNRVLDAIAGSLTNPISQSAKIALQANRELSKSLDGALVDCRITVQDLAQSLESVSAKRKGKNPLNQLVRQFKLNLKEDEIKNVRSQIQTHSMNLQMALQTVNLVVSCSSADRVIEHISFKVDLLASMIASVDVSQVGRSPRQLPGNWIEPDPSIHTRSLKKSAQAVLSTTSSVVGEASVFSGGGLTLRSNVSESGQPLSDTQWTLIESWIAQPDIEENQRQIPASTNERKLSTHVEALKHSAEVNPSSASSAVGEGSVFSEGGVRIGSTASEYGEHLNDSGRARTKGRTALSGVDGESTNNLQISISENTSLPDDRPAPSSCSSGTTALQIQGNRDFNGDSDPEIDLELEIIRKFFETGRARFIQEKFEEAEKFLRPGLKRAGNLSFNHLALRENEILLAMSCVQQNKLEEPEQIFLAMAKERGESDLEAVRILDACYNLATVYLCQSNNKAAQDYCQKAILGRRRLLGKHHSDYYSSLKLMSMIHNRNGDPAAEAIYADLIPPDFTWACDDPVSLQSVLSRLEVTWALAKFDFKYGTHDFKTQRALVWAGNLNVLRFLLRTGANAKTGDADGYGLLHRASVHGHVALVQALLEHGANIEAVETFGRTALLLAAEKGWGLVVQKLIEKGANVKAITPAGATASWLASNNKYRTVAWLLFKNGG